VIARPGVWGEVHVGSYVKDGNGKTWKVVDQNWGDDTIRLEDAAGKPGKIPWPGDDHPVTIMEISTADAVALLKDRLDAVEI
jgi:hypothetical protein